MIYLELDAKTKFSIFFFFFFLGCGSWGLVCGVFFLTGSGTSWGFKGGANKKQVGGGMITG